MPLFKLTITQTAVLEIQADDADAAIQAGHDKLADGLVEFDTAVDSAPVKFDDKTRDQWKRILEDVAGISVYESQDNPEHFGFTGCDSDDYESESEAVIAATVAAGLLTVVGSHIQERSAATDLPVCHTDFGGMWCGTQGPLICERSDAELEAMKSAATRLLCTKFETHRMAHVRGQWGILTEAEMDFGCRDYGDAFGLSVESLCKEAFDIRVDYWKRRLEPIAARFPFSTVYVSHGAASHDGRLCLCAFTPLEMNQDTLDVTSPYRDDVRIADLDTAINELLM